MSQPPPPASRPDPPARSTIGAPILGSVGCIMVAVAAMWFMHRQHQLDRLAVVFWVLGTLLICAIIWIMHYQATAWYYRGSMRFWRSVALGQQSLPPEYMRPSHTGFDQAAFMTEANAANRAQFGPQYSDPRY